MMNQLQVELAERILKVQQEIAKPGSTDLPTYLAASDLHGNAARLEEILATASREGVLQIFLVGDLYSGSRGWRLYQLLKPWVDESDVLAGKVIPLFGNHELAFVTGMLGNDRQLRFFYGFGGGQLIQEMNAELASRGQTQLELSGSESPTAEDLGKIRSSAALQEMARWIQRTHRLFAWDVYGTGYLHACPKITRQGRLDVQFRGKMGLEAIRLMEADLSQADRANHPVFSPLLQTETSPLWALFEIVSAKQFEQAFEPLGVRQLVFGHRHRANPVNIGRLNRQIGIAVDFDQGLGGYLLVGPDALTFRSFVERANHRTTETQLIMPRGELTAAQTYLHDVQEFLFRQLIRTEQAQLDAVPASSHESRRALGNLEDLKRKGFPWIHRLYAELYPRVKDLTLRRQILSAAVESCDEEAFKSFIHLLYHKTRELEGYGSDWYSEPYIEAKSLVQVLLEALREMPVRRLGLLDVRLRGITSRINLLQLYTRIMQLQDPDLAVMAVQNLGALDHWAADQGLGRAFFHDVRKVRVRAAEALARRGEVAYPLVAPLMKSRDNWARFLACWTIGRLGEGGGGLQVQAINEIRCALRDEQDWFLYTTGKEQLRKLRDLDYSSFPDRLEIPNLTDEILAILQSIVDCQNEPFRKAFRVYFITVALSSLVYRRGLLGLDLDELKIYVNDEDYFPVHFRYYKSGDRDHQGQWQGWRRLWIRGETFNRPDGPQVIEIPASDVSHPPRGRQTIILYDHRAGDHRVKLPDLDALVAEHGLGKQKDRVRDFLLQHWDTEFSDAQKGLLSRVHAAAAVKMLFDLPSEIFVTESELRCLERLARQSSRRAKQYFKSLLSFHKSATEIDSSHAAPSAAVCRPNWLDAIKYPVHVRLLQLNR